MRTAYVNYAAAASCRLDPRRTSDARARRCASASLSGTRQSAPPGPGTCRRAARANRCRRCARSVAERVADAFTTTFKKAGYDAKTAPIHGPHARRHGHLRRPVVDRAASRRSRRWRATSRRSRGWASATSGSSRSTCRPDVELRPPRRTRHRIGGSTSAWLPRERQTRGAVRAVAVHRDRTVTRRVQNGVGLGPGVGPIGLGRLCTRSVNGPAIPGAKPSTTTNRVWPIWTGTSSVSVPLTTKSAHPSSVN